MKKTTVPFQSHFTKNLTIGILMLCGIMLSSYKSFACTASFTYTAGVNGHYTFTSTSSGFSFGPDCYWNAGDGTGWQYGTPTFTHIYTANGTYNVELAADDSTCFDTATVAVTITNITVPCTLSAGFNISYGAGGQVTFTSTSGGTNVNTLYYWAPGDSNQRVQGSTVYTHTYMWNGPYTVWLTVEDTGNAYCIDSTDVQITVTNADSGCHFHPDFTYTLDTNGQVTFSSTSVGVGPWALYSWNMGDTSGNLSGYGDSEFVYTYAYNGTHYVTLSVTADSLCTDSITIPVTVTNACNMTANFTYQYDSSGQVKFTSTTSGAQPGAQYGWSFGDSSAYINGYDTATHAYSFIGYYTVVLTVVNPGGCTVSSAPQTIYIYNKDSLQARFIYAPDSLNPGTYNFTSTSKGTNANTYYKWTPGDGSPSDSGLGMTTYTHSYFYNGPDSANLTIWYTILPHSMSSSPRYDLSSYTLLINVTTVTGVKSITDNTVYNIYPNPNNGTFNIAVNGFANEQNAEIRISNMMGKVIYQSNASIKNGNTLSNINLSNAASGIYLLQIITPDNTYTSRIAIQR